MTTTTKPPATAPLAEVENIKQKSRHLRGTLKESLGDPLTRALRADDTHLLKFHGSYQQDDRDLREERRLQKLEPAFSFMLRTRLPGGVCTPKQWLLLDELATRFANGSLRLTTRQAFQLHGVIKPQLKPVMQGIHSALLDTLAACGDVNRNVMCNPNPVDGRVHYDVHACAVKLSEHLLPHTRAYSSIWLDGDDKDEEPVEPIYGTTYLPRKFKIAIAIPPHNDVDVYAHDLSFVAIVDESRSTLIPRDSASADGSAPRLLGFNVLVGGGMGASHGEKATFPRVADVIGFIDAERLLVVAEQVVKVQRDFGDRTNRRHARLKYTIEDRGIAWFKAELETRLGFGLAPARPMTFEHNGDRFGWIRGHDERWHCTLHLESGRVSNSSSGKHLDGLRAIAKLHTGDFRLTANQNLIIAAIDDDKRPVIEALLRAHELDGFERASPLKKNALACVALPTCALAMSEAERMLPGFVARFDDVIARHGVADVRLHLRITGGPNGCARPYLAEVALVGKGPNLYNVHLGGDVSGERLNKLYKESQSEDEAIALLDGIVGRFARERNADEGFGDFCVRAVL